MRLRPAIHLLPVLTEAEVREAVAPVAPNVKRLPTERRSGEDRRTSRRSAPAYDLATGIDRRSAARRAIDRMAATPEEIARLSCGGWRMAGQVHDDGM